MEVAADILRLDESLLEGLLSDGIYMYEQHEFQTAISFLELLTHTDPNNGLIWKLLGSCYQHVDEPGKAEQAYRSALKANPESKDVLTNLGEILISRLACEEAIALFKRVIDQDPHGRDRFGQRARALLLEMVSGLQA